MNRRSKRIFLLLALTALASALPAQAPRALFRAAGQPMRVGNRPADIAVADLNGDNHLDLLTANTGGNTISVLLGDGRGEFRAAAGSPLAGCPVTHLVVPGDVNIDRKLDLAITCHDSNDVIVYLGDGRGGFTPAPGSPFPALTTGQPHNHGLALADVNGDAHPDILTSNQHHHSVSVLLGDGRGGFRPAGGSPFPVGRAPYPLAAGDVNGDGHADVVTPNVGSNNVTVLLGDGRGGFAPAPASPLAVATRPYFVALGDLNGDRRLDLAVAHDDITLITVLLGDGRAGFRPAPGSPLDAGARGGEVLLVDVNGDARLDLVTGTDANTVVVLLGDGSGRFRPAPGSPYAAGRGPWGVAVADINGDGKLDILTANFDDDVVRILLRN